MIMKTFREIINESLTTARERFFEEFPKNEKTEAIFNKLISYDPTPQNKYLDWIVKEYINTHSSDKTSYDLIPELVKWFHNNSQKLGEIRKYSWDQILEMQKESEETKENGKLGIGKLQEGKDYKKLFDNGDTIIFQPLNFKASRAIGGNEIGHKFRSSNEPHNMVSQEWCIVSNRTDWDSYNNKSEIYMIMDLKRNTKYVLQFDIEGRVFKFWDVYDEDIEEWDDLFQETIGELGIRNWFEKLNSKLHDLISKNSRRHS